MRILSHALFLILLTVYIVFSFVTYRGYGITYDEERVFGRADALYTHLLTNNVDPDISHSLLFQSSPEDVNVFYNNTYGMVLRILNPQQLYELYHLYNLLFSCLVLAVVYILFYTVTRNRILAVIPPVFLLLTPVFLGNMPVNPKDIPFAVFYILSICAIFFLSGKRTFWSAIILGILFGLTQGGRIVGFTLYPIFLVYLCISVLPKVRRMKRKQLTTLLVETAGFIGIIILVALFTMSVTWPYLGSSFFKRFILLFKVGKEFPWNGNVIFAGKTYAGNDLPRSYIPVMFLVKTPLFILLLSACSWLAVRKKKFVNLVILCWTAIIANLSLYLVFNPVSLIRHYLYIYPLLAILAAVGLVGLWIRVKNAKIKLFVFGLIAVNMVIVAVQTTKLFPYGYIYLNELVGGTGKGAKLFPTGDWALSNREAAEWLIGKADHGKDTFVYTCGNAQTAYYFYPSWLKNTDDLKKAEYVICGTPVRSSEQMIRGKLIHTVERSGVVLNRIYKMKP